MSLRRTPQSALLKVYSYLALSVLWNWLDSIVDTVYADVVPIRTTSECVRLSHMSLAPVFRMYTTNTSTSITDSMKMLHATPKARWVGSDLVDLCPTHPISHLLNETQASDPSAFDCTGVPLTGVNPDHPLHSRICVCTWLFHKERSSGKNRPSRETG